MRFKLSLSNWTTDRFEIRSVARSKVTIMIFGLNSFFQYVGCAEFSLSWFYNSKVTTDPRVYKYEYQLRF